MQDRHFAHRPVIWTGFWLVAAGFYLWFFGRNSGSALDTLDVTVPLLLIAMATAWLLAGVLVPRFLLAGRYGLFALYAFYTLVVSIWLVLAVVVGVFMASGYSTRTMNPAALDRPALVVGVFVVVAMAMVVSLVLRWNELKSVQEQLVQARRRAELQLADAEAALRVARGEGSVLEIQVDRQTVRLKATEILYLEAAADYVLVSTPDDRLITKARLGDLAAELAPHGFVRVHRSFVVRLASVDAFTSREVTIGETTIPVSRSYRGAVASLRESTG